MNARSVEPIYENRYDAGRKLALELEDYKGKSAIVLGIPNGGLPIALGVALGLDAEFNFVISRKIPLPLAPEGGFGAMTDDGTILLNDALVKKFGLTEQQINFQVNQVRAEIRNRLLTHQRHLQPARISERSVILVDDGLASGYTMMAAVKSVRKRNPQEIIVAIPVAPAVSVRAVEKIADRVITCITGDTEPFYVADYYRYWYEVDDDEAAQCLREVQMRRYRDILDPMKDRPARS
ncbi:phosphoribosyltransferase [Chloroflexota bacterium]